MMNQMANQMAKIAVLADRKAVAKLHKFGINAFGLYACEVLSHAGISCDMLDDVSAVVDAGYDAIIAAVCGEDERSMNALNAYMSKGGLVFSCAGLNKLASRLGYAKGEQLNVGYAELSSGEEGEHPLRFLKAEPWISVKAERTLPLAEKGTIVLGMPHGESAGAALQVFPFESGRLYRWSVDIWDTIVRMQQGKGPVLEDGAPANDGTGAVNDGILKADDQAAVDWVLDRKTTETGMPYFPYPYADLWREAFVGELLTALANSGKALPFIGYYPDGVTNIAMISHDSDGNKDEYARAAMAVLAECGVHSTWCMLEPGYSKEVYEEIKAAGHELAFHYNGLEAQKGIWSEEEFRRQLSWLESAAELDEVVSNKNHYTRFEGWGELFEWCERYGIAADQTRGPSKKGNVGMLFGTCHPYFPISWFDDGNRLYDVLEMSFLTQDLELSTLSDNSVIRPFLQAVKRVDGIAHFLYHQVHIHNWEAVRNSVRLLVSEARKLGFEFWTGKKVNEWERYRRKLKIKLESDGNVRLEGSDSSYNVVVYVPMEPSAVSTPGIETTVRFGVPCRRVALRS